ncbi:galactokinase [Virgibacillus natechei]|uniref:Galactokinase n=1 Tax=Virgibacillus natechei TaxID=1216297 RepID=A0ABS4IFZ8_9BACI|nr:galactokinase [Virgibacillus natechei]MBP1969261.1 galactokinase [Virgibacillus natechei]UZD12419.1 galactokinase [Virgibacillus natechei]
MTAHQLKQSFQKIFKTTEVPQTFFAPGRINLIGEHTDYNGGNVFPASISFGTYALGRKRSDQKLRFYSMNFPQAGIIECDLSNLDYNEAHDWANYPKGMLLYLQKAGYEFPHGADILFHGNIPNGAGLSSSASIEMATGVLLEGLFDLEIDRIRMIQLGQKVENEYIGVNSGIMDQFAIGMGKKDHAILLNCQTLDYEYAPLGLKDHVIQIINTNKQRTLAGSKYNERREQCDRALIDLQAKLSINSLGDLTKEEFDQHKHLIKDETNQKRAKHAVYENVRTLEALEKLREDDLEAFGKLMNESHLSLKQDYEVTGMELDTIIQAAWDQEGVLGARMTGAGFGGCAIAIVEKDKVEDFKKNVNAFYHKAVGYDATFYTATIGDGAKETTEGVVK